MRILLVAPPWLPVPPPSYGGTETVLDHLARGLAEAGQEVVLYATGDSTCPVGRAWTYETGQAPRIGDLAVELCHVLGAYEDLASFDIVHDHTLIGPVRAAAARTSPPVVTTNHGPFTDELAAIYRSIAHQIPIIAISRHQASSAVATPIARVIHHGIDPADFPVGAGTGGYVAFMGRMAPTKGVDIAARTARNAGVPLRIAAKMREPAERDYFEATIRPLLGGDVEYVGELNAHDKVELLQGASALLNPIRWHEPFGMVMIEALACGTPVLAPNRGSVPEIVDHGRTGFVCRDEADFVEHLGLIGSLSRRDCRAAVETRFSARRMVADHLALYRDVVERRDPLVDLTEPAPTAVGAAGSGSGALTGGGDRSLVGPMGAGSPTSGLERGGLRLVGPPEGPARQINGSAAEHN